MSSHVSRATLAMVPFAFVALTFAFASPSAATTFEARTITSTDDAEESPGQSTYLGSSDLELTHDSVDQTVGMRWVGVSIPRGAHISAAYIQFSAKESQSETTALTFRAQAADNAGTFTTTVGNVSGRSLTSASTAWSPAAWTAGQVTSTQRTPDLSGAVQEVVNRSGWSSGNALAIIVTGTGHRTAWAYDGAPASSPLLHVEYTTGSGTDSPPVAQLTVTQLASPALTVTADASNSTDTDATAIASYKFDFGDGSSTVTTTAPTAKANHTYSSTGSRTVTVTVTDAAGLSSSASATITVGGTTTYPATVERREATSSDDAEESATGSVSLTSSDLELVYDGSNQTVGMRWTSIAIPRGATITGAYIQFVANESQSEVTNLVIRGQAADNAATFTSSSTNVSSRPRTTASASWAPSPWNAGDDGAVQRTPDLGPIVQEIVNRSSWSSGNALAIIINGTGHRTADSYDGSSIGGPLLHIDYLSTSPPATDNPPVANLTVSQQATPALTVLADASASTDVDVTPIASYTFDFGDGSSKVTVNAPNATATHTYSSAGSKTITVSVKDGGGKTSSTSTTIDVASTSTSSSGVVVYVGYYDTHHSSHLKTKPSPWKGSSNVTFVGSADPGTTNGWDSSCIRIDNTTSSTITGVTVTCDIGSSHFALWSSQSIGAGKTLILAQTGVENFDGSDTNPAGCYGCSSSLCLTKVLSTKPVVHVTFGGKKTDYIDTNQIMNTKGVDGAGCPYTGTRNDESSPWTKVNPSTAAAASPAAAGDDPFAMHAILMPPWPNPSRGAIDVEFSLIHHGKVQLAVYDVMGRQVESLINTELEPGHYRGEMPLRGVSAGMYYLVLNTVDGSLKKSMVRL